MYITSASALRIVRQTDVAVSNECATFNYNALTWQCAVGKDIT